MRLALFIIFGFSFFTTLVGVLILVLMIRARAPHEGIRHWVEESRNTKLYWKERPFSRGRPGTLAAEDFTVRQDTTMSALQDVENLQQAATKIRDEMLERRKNSAGVKADSRNVNLPPAIAPRPKGKKWKSIEESTQSVNSEYPESVQPEN